MNSYGDGNIPSDGNYKHSQSPLKQPMYSPQMWPSSENELYRFYEDYHNQQRREMAKVPPNQGAPVRCRESCCQQQYVDPQRYPLNPPPSSSFRYAPRLQYSMNIPSGYSDSPYSKKEVPFENFIPKLSPPGSNISQPYANNKPVLKVPSQYPTYSTRESSRIRPPPPYYMTPQEMTNTFNTPLYNNNIPPRSNFDTRRPKWEACSYSDYSRQIPYPTSTNMPMTSQYNTPHLYSQYSPNFQLQPLQPPSSVNSVNHSFNVNLPIYDSTNPTPEANVQSKKSSDKIPEISVREFLANWDENEDETSLKPPEEEPITVVSCSSFEGDGLADVREQLKGRSVQIVPSNHTESTKLPFDMGNATIVQVQNTDVNSNNETIKSSYLPLDFTKTIVENVDKEHNKKMEFEALVSYYGDTKKDVECNNYELVEITERFVDATNKICNTAFDSNNTKIQENPKADLKLGLPEKKTVELLDDPEQFIMPSIIKKSDYCSKSADASDYLNRTPSPSFCDKPINSCSKSVDESSFSNKPTPVQNLHTKTEDAPEFSRKLVVSDESTSSSDFSNKPSISPKFCSKPSISSDFSTKSSIPSDFGRKSSVPSDFCSEPPTSSTFCNKPSISPEFSNKPSVPSDVCNKPSTTSDFCSKSSISSDFCNKSSVTANGEVDTSQYFKKSKWYHTYCNDNQESPGNNTAQYTDSNYFFEKRFDSSCPPAPCLWENNSPLEKTSHSKMTDLNYNSNNYSPSASNYSHEDGHLKTFTKDYLSEHNKILTQNVQISPIKGNPLMSSQVSYTQIVENGILKNAPVEDNNLISEDKKTTICDSDYNICRNPVTQVDKIKNENKNNFDPLLSSARRSSYNTDELEENEKKSVLDECESDESPGDYISDEIGKDDDNLSFFCENSFDGDAMSELNDSEDLIPNKSLKSNEVVASEPMRINHSPEKINKIVLSKRMSQEKKESINKMRGYRKKKITNQLGEEAKKEYIETTEQRKPIKITVQKTKIRIKSKENQIKYRTQFKLKSCKDNSEEDKNGIKKIIVPCKNRSELGKASGANIKQCEKKNKKLKALKKSQPPVREETTCEKLRKCKFKLMKQNITQSSLQNLSKSEIYDFKDSDEDKKRPECKYNNSTSRNKTETRKPIERDLLEKKQSQVLNIELDDICDSSKLASSADLVSIKSEIVSVSSSICLSVSSDNDSHSNTFLNNEKSSEKKEVDNEVLEKMPQMIGRRLKGSNNPNLLQQTHNTKANNISKPEIKYMEDQKLSQNFMLVEENLRKLHGESNSHKSVQNLGYLDNMVGNNNFQESPENLTGDKTKTFERTDFRNVNTLFSNNPSPLQSFHQMQTQSSDSTNESSRISFEENNSSCIFGTSSYFAQNSALDSKYNITDTPVAAHCMNNLDMHLVNRTSENINGSNSEKSGESSFLNKYNDFYYPNESVNQFEPTESQFPYNLCSLDANPFLKDDSNLKYVNNVHKLENQIGIKTNHSNTQYSDQEIANSDLTTPEVQENERSRGDFIEPTKHLISTYEKTRVSNSMERNEVCKNINLVSDKQTTSEFDSFPTINSSKSVAFKNGKRIVNLQAKILQIKRECLISREPAPLFNVPLEAVSCESNSKTTHHKTEDILSTDISEICANRSLQNDLNVDRSLSNSGDFPGNNSIAKNENCFENFDGNDKPSDHYLDYFVSDATHTNDKHLTISCSAEKSQKPNNEPEAINSIEGSTPHRNIEEKVSHIQSEPICSISCASNSNSLNINITTTFAGNDNAEAHIVHAKQQFSCSEATLTTDKIGKTFEDKENKTTEGLFNSMPASNNDLTTFNSVPTQNANSSTNDVYKTKQLQFFHLSKTDEVPCTSVIQEQNSAKDGSTIDATENNLITPEVKKQVPHDFISKINVAAQVKKMNMEDAKKVMTEIDNTCTEKYQKHEINMVEENIPASFVALESNITKNHDLPVTMSPNKSFREGEKTDPLLEKRAAAEPINITCVNISEQNHSISTEININEGVKDGSSPGDTYKHSEKAPESNIRLSHSIDLRSNMEVTFCKSSDYENNLKSLESRELTDSVDKLRDLKYLHYNLEKENTVFNEENTTENEALSSTKSNRIIEHNITSKIIFEKNKSDNRQEVHSKNIEIKGQAIPYEDDSEYKKTDALNDSNPKASNNQKYFETNTCSSPIHSAGYKKLNDISSPCESSNKISELEASKPHTVELKKDVQPDILKLATAASFFLDINSKKSESAKIHELNNSKGNHDISPETLYRTKKQQKEDSKVLLSSQKSIVIGKPSNIEDLISTEETTEENGSEKLHVKILPKENLAVPSDTVQVTKANLPLGKISRCSVKQSIVPDKQNDKISKEITSASNKPAPVANQKMCTRSSAIQSVNTPDKQLDKLSTKENISAVPVPGNQEKMSLCIPDEQSDKRPAKENTTVSMIPVSPVPILQEKLSPISLLKQNDKLSPEKNTPVLNKAIKPVSQEKISLGIFDTTNDKRSEKENTSVCITPVPLIGQKTLYPSSPDNKLSSKENSTVLNKAVSTLPVTQEKLSASSPDKQNDKIETTKSTCVLNKDAPTEPVDQEKMSPCSPGKQDDKILAKESAPVLNKDVPTEPVEQEKMSPGSLDKSNDKISSKENANVSSKLVPVPDDQEKMSPGSPDKTNDKILTKENANVSSKFVPIPVDQEKMSPGSPDKTNDKILTKENANVSTKFVPVPVDQEKMSLGSPDKTNDKISTRENANVSSKLAPVHVKMSLGSPDKTNDKISTKENVNVSSKLVPVPVDQEKMSPGSPDKTNDKISTKENANVSSKLAPVPVKMSPGSHDKSNAKRTAKENTSVQKKIILPVPVRPENLSPSRPDKRSEKRTAKENTPVLNKAVPSVPVGQEKLSPSRPDKRNEKKSAKENTTVSSKSAPVPISNQKICTIGSARHLTNILHRQKTKISVKENAHVSIETVQLAQATIPIANVFPSVPVKQTSYIPDVTNITIFANENVGVTSKLSLSEHKIPPPTCIKKVSETSKNIECVPTTISNEQYIGDTFPGQNIHGSKQKSSEYDKDFLHKVHSEQKFNSENRKGTPDLAPEFRSPSFKSNCIERNVNINPENILVNDLSMNPLDPRSSGKHNFSSHGKSKITTAANVYDYICVNFDKERKKIGYDVTETPEKCLSSEHHKPTTRTYITTVYTYNRVFEQNNVLMKLKPKSKNVLQQEPSKSNPILKKDCNKKSDNFESENLCQTNLFDLRSKEKVVDESLKGKEMINLDTQSIHADINKENNSGCFKIIINPCDKQKGTSQVNPTSLQKHSQNVVNTERVTVQKSDINNFSILSPEKIVSQASSKSGFDLDLNSKSLVPQKPSHRIRFNSDSENIQLSSPKKIISYTPDSDNLIVEKDTIPGGEQIECSEIKSAENTIAVTDTFANENHIDSKSKKTSAGGNGTCVKGSNETAKSYETAVSNETSAKNSNKSTTGTLNQTTLEKLNKTIIGKLNQTYAKSATEDSNETCGKELNKSSAEKIDETIAEKCNEAAIEELNETGVQKSDETASGYSIETCALESTETVSEDSNETLVRQSTETTAKDLNESYARQSTETASEESIETWASELTETFAEDFIETSTGKSNETANADSNNAFTGQVKETASEETCFSESTETVAEESIETSAEKSTETAAADSNETCATRSTETVGKEFIETCFSESTKTVSEESIDACASESTGTFGEESIKTSAKKSTETAAADSNETCATRSTETVGKEFIETCVSESTKTVSEESIDAWASESTGAFGEESIETSAKKSTETAAADSNETCATRSTETVGKEFIETCVSESTKTVAEESIDACAPELTETFGKDSIEISTGKSTDTAAAESDETFTRQATETASEESIDTCSLESTETASEELMEVSARKSIETAAADSNETYPARSTETVCNFFIETCTSESTMAVSEESIEPIAGKSTDTAADLNETFNRQTNETSSEESPETCSSESSETASEESIEATARKSTETAAADSNETCPARSTETVDKEFIETCASESTKTVAEESIEISTGKSTDTAADSSKTFTLQATETSSEESIETSSEETCSSESTETVAEESTEISSKEATETAAADSIETCDSRSTETVGKESIETCASGSTKTVAGKSIEIITGKSTDTASADSNETFTRQVFEMACEESSETCSSESTETAAVDSIETCDSRSTETVGKESIETCASGSTKTIAGKSIEIITGKSTDTASADSNETFTRRVFEMASEESSEHCSLESTETVAEESTETCAWESTEIAATDSNKPFTQELTEATARVSNTTAEKPNQTSFRNYNFTSNNLNDTVIEKSNVTCAENSQHSTFETLNKTIAEKSNEIVEEANVSMTKITQQSNLVVVQESETSTSKESVEISEEISKKEEFSMRNSIKQVSGKGNLNVNSESCEIEVSTINPSSQFEETSVAIKMPAFLFNPGEHALEPEILGTKYKQNAKDMSLTNISRDKSNDLEWRKIIKNPNSIHVKNVYLKENNNSCSHEQESFIKIVQHPDSLNTSIKDVTNSVSKNSSHRTIAPGRKAFLANTVDKQAMVNIQNLVPAVKSSIKISQENKTNLKFNLPIGYGKYNDDNILTQKKLDENWSHVNLDEIPLPPQWYSRGKRSASENEMIEDVAKIEANLEVHGSKKKDGNVEADDMKKINTNIEPDASKNTDANLEPYYFKKTNANTEPAGLEKTDASVEIDGFKTINANIDLDGFKKAVAIIEPESIEKKDANTGIEKINASEEGNGLKKVDANIETNCPKKLVEITKRRKYLKSIIKFESMKRQNITKASNLPSKPEIKIRNMKPDKLDKKINKLASTAGAPNILPTYPQSIKENKECPRSASPKICYTEKSAKIPDPPNWTERAEKPPAFSGKVNEVTRNVADLHAQCEQVFRQRTCDNRDKSFPGKRYQSPYRRSTSMKYIDLKWEARNKIDSRRDYHVNSYNNDHSSNHEARSSNRRLDNTCDTHNKSSKNKQRSYSPEYTTKRSSKNIMLFSNCNSGEVFANERDPVHSSSLPIVEKNYISKSEIFTDEERTKIDFNLSPNSLSEEIDGEFETNDFVVIDSWSETEDITPEVSSPAERVTFMCNDYKESECDDDLAKNRGHIPDRSSDYQHNTATIKDDQIEYNPDGPEVDSQTIMKAEDPSIRDNNDSNIKFIEENTSNNTISVTAEVVVEQRITNVQENPLKDDMKVVQNSIKHNKDMVSQSTQSFSHDKNSLHKESIKNVCLILKDSPSKTLETKSEIDLNSVQSCQVTTFKDTESTKNPNTGEFNPTETLQEAQEKADVPTTDESIKPSSNLDMKNSCISSVIDSDVSFQNKNLFEESKHETKLETIKDGSKINSVEENGESDSCNETKCKNETKRLTLMRSIEESEQHLGSLSENTAENLVMQSLLKETTVNDAGILKCVKAHVLEKDMPNSKEDKTLDLSSSINDQSRLVNETDVNVCNSRKQLNDKPSLKYKDFLAARKDQRKSKKGISKADAEIISNQSEFSYGLRERKVKPVPENTSRSNTRLNLKRKQNMDPDFDQKKRRLCVSKDIVTEEETCTGALKIARPKCTDEPAFTKTLKHTEITNTLEGEVKITDESSVKMDDSASGSCTVITTGDAIYIELKSQTENFSILNTDCYVLINNDTCPVEMPVVIFEGADDQMCVENKILSSDCQTQSSPTKTQLPPTLHPFWNDRKTIEKKQKAIPLLKPEQLLLEPDNRKTTSSDLKKKDVNHMKLASGERKTRSSTKNSNNKYKSSHGISNQCDLREENIQLKKAKDGFVKSKTAKSKANTDHCEVQETKENEDLKIELKNLKSVECKENIVNTDNLTKEIESVSPLSNIKTTNIQVKNHDKDQINKINKRKRLKSYDEETNKIAKRKVEKTIEIEGKNYDSKAEAKKSTEKKTDGETNFTIKHITKAKRKYYENNVGIDCNKLKKSSNNAQVSSDCEERGIKNISNDIEKNVSNVNEPYEAASGKEVEIKGKSRNEAETLKKKTPKETLKTQSRQVSNQRKKLTVESKNECIGKKSKSLTLLKNKLNVFDANLSLFKTEEDKDLKSIKIIKKSNKEICLESAPNKSDNLSVPTVNDKELIPEPIRDINIHEIQKNNLTGEQIKEDAYLEQMVSDTLKCMSEYSVKSTLEKTISPEKVENAKLSSQIGPKKRVKKLKHVSKSKTGNLLEVSNVKELPLSGASNNIPKCEKTCVTQTASEENFLRVSESLSHVSMPVPPDGSDNISPKATFPSSFVDIENSTELHSSPSISDNVSADTNVSHCTANDIVLPTVDDPFAILFKEVKNELKNTYQSSKVNVFEKGNYLLTSHFEREPSIEDHHGLKKREDSRFIFDAQLPLYEESRCDEELENILVNKAVSNETTRNLSPFSERLLKANNENPHEKEGRTEMFFQNLNFNKKEYYRRWNISDTSPLENVTYSSLKMNKPSDIQPSPFLIKENAMMSKCSPTEEFRLFSEAPQINRSPDDLRVLRNSYQPMTYSRKSIPQRSNFPLDFDNGYPHELMPLSNDQLYSVDKAKYEEIDVSSGETCDIMSYVEDFTSFPNNSIDYNSSYYTGDDTDIRDIYASPTTDTDVYDANNNPGYLENNAVENSTNITAKNYVRDPTEVFANDPAQSHESVEVSDKKAKSHLIEAVEFPVDDDPKVLANDATVKFENHQNSVKDGTSSLSSYPTVSESHVTYTAESHTSNSAEIKLHANSSTEPIEENKAYNEEHSIETPKDRMHISMKSLNWDLSHKVQNLNINDDDELVTNNTEVRENSVEVISLAHAAYQVLDACMNHCEQPFELLIQRPPQLTVLSNEQQSASLNTEEGECLGIYSEASSEFVSRTFENSKAHPAALSSDPEIHQPNSTIADSCQQVIEQDEMLTSSIIDWPYLEEEVVTQDEQVKIGDETDINDFKIKLPWSRIFNLANDDGLDNSGTQQKCLELGPVEIKLQLNSFETSCLKVKRLILQKATNESTDRDEFEEIKTNQPSVLLSRVDIIEDMVEHNATCINLCDLVSCDFCERQLLSKDFLSQHLYNLHELHTCTVCDETFSGYLLFLSHNSSHRELHHCLLCQKTFTRVDKLRLHEQTASHRQLLAVQRQTIHALFKCMSGRECPHLQPLSPEEIARLNWRPSDPNTIHYYHPTPLDHVLQKNKESQSCLPSEEYKDSCGGEQCNR